MGVTHTALGNFRSQYRHLLRQKKGGKTPNVDTVPLILIEGDSWVSMPPYHDLGDHLERTTNAVYLRMGKHGDTAADMFAPANLAKLRSRLSNFRFDLLLVSAGGNDLANALDKHRIFAPGDPPTTPAKAAARVDASGLFKRLASAYKALLAVTRGTGVHVIGHTYAYPQRMGAPTRLTVQNIGLIAVLKRQAGDWIQRHIRHVLPDEDDQREFVRLLLDAFHDQVLAAQPAADFSYMDFRTTLPHAKDWNDELHPTEAAFGLLAKAMKVRIAQCLPPAKQPSL